MRVIKINEHITAFYFHGDSSSETLKTARGAEEDWANGGCNALGVCCYTIHSGHNALVYDTLADISQASQVRAHLEKQGINKFTVAISHWHLDHVGGNAVFSDSNIISTLKTRNYLQQYKQDIEAGKLWGPPAINPLVLPTLTFDRVMNFYLENVEIQMLNLDIHSDDSSYLYIPKYKILLSGDMLEDSCPFIVNPADIPTHLKNLAILREMEISRIYPNHGSYSTIMNKGYDKALIDSASNYLSRIHKLVNEDINCKEPGLEEFMACYFDNGTLRYWPPYESVHQGNFRRCKAYLSEGWSAADGL